MSNRLLSSLIGAGLAFGIAVPALAHPHVFIDSRSEFVMDETRSLTAVRHKWTFDPAFSAYALQGLDENGDGEYSREELAELAQVNVESLAEYEFFTFVESGGTEVAFNEPINYWLDYDGVQLTLNFTLPLVETLSISDQPATMQVYDPTIFVAFFLDKEEPATIAGGNGACTMEHLTVGENKLDSTTDFSDDFLAAIDELDNFASQFAEEIKLTCAQGAG